MIHRRTLLLASAAMAIAVAPLAARPFKRRRSATVRLTGARAPIEIAEDSDGLPHIRAASKHDAFFGQGYVVARDRLFQIDLGTRQGLGRMAEAFGARFIPADTAARLFLFRGDVAAELAGMPAEVVDCVRGYVAGINARIAEVEADPSLLPPEYGLLGIRPLRWTLEDMVRIRGVSAGDADDEVRRARLQARGLLEVDQLMEPLRPAWHFTIPTGLDCTQVSEADLGILAAAAKRVAFVEGEVIVQNRVQDRIDLAAHGSNAWTVAGSRTATGRPILANDPHLGIGDFNPRHLAHLTAPGLDVIGAGAPGLPGIMQGHTDRYAFGRTNFHIDQTDLFILETKADDPDRYRHHGQWKRFDTVVEEIAVKNAAPVRVTLRYAQGRPIISQDSARRRAIAFATVALLPGANMNFAITAMNLSRDWTELQSAFANHSSPTNFHYADTAGHTAWQAIGFTPRRPRHDGLLPAPGDGSYDWTGVLAVDEMPAIRDPEAGWFASANQLNLPAGFPNIVSFSWNDPFRYDRIAAVLSAQPRHRIEDSVALQHDVESLPARALTRLLPKTPTPAAAPAAALLRRWDCGIDAGSAAALLYELVTGELTKLAHAALVPAAARDLVTTVNQAEMLRLLAAPDARFGADPAAARDALIDQALAAGWKKAASLAGADPASWRWGDLHQVTIAHALSSIPVIAAAFPKLTVGPSGGDGTTVMARGFNVTRGYGVMHGASYLMVADVGEWDNSRILLLPGQSADPRSPHYRDLAADWLAGRPRRLIFSRAAVDADTVAVTTVIPAKG